MNNLGFKDFLREVAIPTTPEDEKDSVYFELVEWANSKFVGVPSVEVQQMVDLNIPVWLGSFNNAEDIMEQLCKIQGGKSGVRTAVIAARYIVEKYCEDEKQTRAVELVEKWLEDESSVTAKELSTAAYEAVGANSAVAYATADAAWAAELEITDFNRGENNFTMFTMFWAARITSHKEICEVIVEKLPKFRYEDLLQRGYFSP